MTGTSMSSERAADEPSVRRLRRIPRGLPFVVRLSVWRYLAAMAVAIGILELGLPFAFDTEEVSWLTTQAVIVGTCGFALVIVGTRGPQLAMSPDGLWFVARSWPRVVVWLPWSQVAWVGDARYQWYVALGVKLRDPDALSRRRLGKRIGTQVEEARKACRGADLSLAITMTTSNSAEIQRALDRLAPTTVGREFVVVRAEPAGWSPTVTWGVRVVIAVVWVVGTVFAVPALVGSVLDSANAESVAAYVTGGVATAGLAPLYAVFERYRRTHPRITRRPG
jgi:hypothetical protein